MEIRPKNEQTIAHSPPKKQAWFKQQIKCDGCSMLHVGNQAYKRTGTELE